MTKSKMHYDLEKVALRCTPFQTAEETLSDTNFFLAYVFTYGEVEDIKIMNKHFDKEALANALQNAPPGIIDPRSWAYWNLILRDLSPPPMPTRTFA